MPLFYICYYRALENIRQNTFAMQSRAGQLQKMDQVDYDDYQFLILNPSAIFFALVICSVCSEC